MAIIMASTNTEKPQTEKCAQATKWYTKMPMGTHTQVIEKLKPSSSSSRVPYRARAHISWPAAIVAKIWANISLYCFHCIALGEQ